MRGVGLRGQWRQWHATASLSASAVVGESRLFVLNYAVRVLRVLVMLAIWRSLLERSPEASSLPLATLLTYTVVGEIFSGAMEPRTPLANSLWQGTLVNYYLRPAGIVRQFAAEWSGRFAIDLLCLGLPLLLVAGALGLSVAPAGLGAGLYFGLSLLCAFGVGLALEFLFGIVAMILDQPVWLVEWTRQALQRLLSGAIIPLVLLPFGLGDVFEWLPFAATAWAPLAIYTGAGEPLRLLALQFAWLCALWPFTLWLWSSHREKVVSYGG